MIGEEEVRRAVTDIKMAVELYNDLKPMNSKDRATVATILLAMCLRVHSNDEVGYLKLVTEVSHALTEAPKELPTGVS